MAGIYNIAPKSPARNTSEKPELSPRNPEMISFDKNPCISPIAKTIITT